MTIHVFTGPTLAAEEVAACVPAAEVHPPVEHGDLLALSLRRDDVVVIIDGYYHQRAPVRHKEVLEVIARGVSVVGCASMGALRAAELAPCGMIGHGRVFEMYVNGEIDADDEVAVAHLPGDRFEARNVPLVNVRFAVAQAVDAGVITAEHAAAVVASARDLHYTERSWRNVRSSSEWPSGPEVVSEVVAFLRENPSFADLKRRDALETLQNLTEIVRSAQRIPEFGHWQNPHVYEWLPEFEGTREGDGVVSEADVVRYRQVYEAEFPALWREFVVTETSRRPDVTATPDDPAGVAEQVFTGAGAMARVLSRENEFVTGEERSQLTDDETLVRTLVRCYRPPRGLHDVMAGISGPGRATEIRERIREARRLNDQVLWRNRIRLVERLSHDRLVRHLETLWGLPARREDALRAHARDRGIPSVLDAVGVVRPYFLRDDANAGGTATERWSVTR